VTTHPAGKDSSVTPPAIAAFPGLVYDGVRENVCNNSKNREFMFFLDFEKKR